MNKLLQIVLASLLAFGLSSPAAGEPVEVPKTNPMKVYMHYMPWFETPQTLGAGQWGYHWTMQNQNPNIVDATGRRQIAAHYYPKIGPYASRDPDVIEYHLLLMKYAGVDGLMIDWYGIEGTNGDIDDLLTSSNAVVNDIGGYGLDFGVILEDRFSANVEQAKANLSYLKNHYFSHPSYLRPNASGDPWLGVFGPITFQSPSPWTEILGEAGEEVDFATLWYEQHEAGANADGEYAWVYEDAHADNHLLHTASFYLNRAPTLDVSVGAAYPGFDDFYVEGGAGELVHFDIPHEDGQTLAQTLALADQHAANVDMLQLVTWNDFGEGTMLEPTVENNFDYLLQVQEFTGAPFGEAELELIYRLYLARKEYTGDAVRQSALDEVAALLAGLEVEAAAEMLGEAAPAGDYNGDGVVDAADYVAWRASFGEETILIGSGADGNHDGVVNTADYTVWRDTLGQGSPGAAAGSIAVPEPCGGTLRWIAILAAIGRGRWARRSSGWR